MRKQRHTGGWRGRVQQQRWQQQWCRWHGRTGLRAGSPRWLLVSFQGEPRQVQARLATAYDPHDRSAPRRSVPRRYTNSTLYHSRLPLCLSADSTLLAGSRYILAIVFFLFRRPTIEQSNHTLAAKTFKRNPVEKPVVA